MSKFISVVKFKVITEEENNFIEAMKKYNLPDGLIYRRLIKTGEYSYCSIIEWVNEEALENARPQMIAFLDTIRNMLIEFNQDLAQTYSVLSCTTECGVNQHIQWDSDWQRQISGEWTSLVNPASMTDEDGNGKIVFAVWEEFIGETITIYGTYTDDCGNNFLNSVKVKVVDNE